MSCGNRQSHSRYDAIHKLASHARGMISTSQTDLATITVDEKRVVVTVEDNSESSSHCLGSNVDFAILVGRDVDLIMANVVFIHEGDVFFG